MHLEWSGRQDEVTTTTPWPLIERLYICQAPARAIGTVATLGTEVLEPKVADSFG